MRPRVIGAQEAYLTPVAQPSLSVSVSKMDNGYTVDLFAPPKMLEKAPARVADPVDPDEMVDKMIDGFSAFVRHLNDRAAGETWKADDDRDKLREGFKLMFPSIVRLAEPGPDCFPTNEHKVFEKKEDLLRYLEEKL